DEEFRPQPGKIQSMHMAGGIGVRVDTAVYQGYTIPPFYDSMIAKVIAFGSDRKVASARMKRALSEMLFEGIVTNTDYQLSILLSKAFETADFNTNSIEEGIFTKG
ncbi:MAG: acetyl-CoA carboxylase biotin carboxylase subunit, partial [Butyricicoccus sp.]|nr:acetyl-CoA carboxylase biotin carboxylase subunit [Butyricicoccus sp.]